MLSLSEADRQLLSDVHALMREYGISRRCLLEILGVTPSRTAFTGPIPRPLQTYCNPHTGVCIRVRTGKSLAYRAWCAEFGEDVVAGWTIEAPRHSR